MKRGKNAKKINLTLLCYGFMPEINVHTFIHNTVNELQKHVNKQAEPIPDVFITAAVGMQLVAVMVRCG